MMPICQMKKTSDRKGMNFSTCKWAIIRPAVGMFVARALIFYDSRYTS